VDLYEVDSLKGNISFLKTSLRNRARLIPQVNVVSLDSAGQSPLSSIPAHLYMAYRLVEIPKRAEG
jgi:hypothetical protein